jgi:uncharacterized SAM-binding protein YcdF (DUF218 family)
MSSLEWRSYDAENVALMIMPLVGNVPCYAVKSASCMPRSIARFRKRGLNPIAAPTEHQA